MSITVSLSDMFEGTMLKETWPGNVSLKDAAEAMVSDLQHFDPPRSFEGHMSEVENELLESAWHQAQQNGMDLDKPATIAQVPDSHLAAFIEAEKIPLDAIMSVPGPLSSAAYDAAEAKALAIPAGDARKILEKLAESTTEERAELYSYFPTPREAMAAAARDFLNGNSHYTPNDFDAWSHECCGLNRVRFPNGQEGWEAAITCRHSDDFTLSDLDSGLNAADWHQPEWAHSSDRLGNLAPPANTNLATIPADHLAALVRAENVETAQWPQAADVLLDRTDQLKAQRDRAASLLAEATAALEAKQAPAPETPTARRPGLR